MMQNNFGFVQSEWMPPETLPDLSDAKVIAFDLETYDPKLKTTGPGWTSRVRHIYWSPPAPARRTRCI